MIRRLHYKKTILITLVAILAFLAVGTFELFSVMLIRSQNIVGWILFFLILFLAAYQIRKKFSFLPVGSASQWLNIHIVVAFLSFFLFYLHAGINIPNGMFEIILFILYLSVFVSGVIGFILSRTIPPRLTSRGEEVIFERIPLYLSRIRNNVEDALFTAEGEKTSQIISEFYLKNLRNYFLQPANLARHLFHSEHHKQQLLHKISELERFLTDSEIQVARQISEQVSLKDDIDYQYSLQAVLKLWLFIHVPLTYSLILFALFHAIVASAFSSLI
jgi:hypothetical protein